MRQAKNKSMPLLFLANNNQQKQGVVTIAALEFLQVGTFSDNWQLFLRFMLTFISALAIVRLMGNRTVAQLSPFDFVILVGIGDILMAGALDQRPTLFNCLMALLGLLILQQLMGYLALKNFTLRKWFEGTPVDIIVNGKLVNKNLAKTHLNYDDLRQELHRKGLEMTDLPDIKFARLESCGEFSVVMNDEKNPLTKEDFENCFKKISDNPLSHAGEKWLKIEKFISDVEYLVGNLKKQNGQSDFQDIDNEKNYKSHVSEIDFKKLH